MNLSSYNSKFYLFYLKKQLFKSVIEFKNNIPNLHKYNQRYNQNLEQISEIDYDKDWHFISRKLVSKQVIDILINIMINFIRINEFVINNKIISKNNISVKTDSRYFGTVFSVSYFRKIVLANNVCLKEKLFNLAKKITNLIDQIDDKEEISFKLVTLTIYALDYIKLFKQWSFLDKEYLVYTLAKQYLINEIKLTAPLSDNEDTNNLYITAFKQEQNNIKSEVTYLGNNELKNTFFDLISSIENYQIVEKKLYWLDVDFSLQKEVPDVDTVLNLFKESKRLMKNLINNREDLKAEIDNNIDEKIIEIVLKEKEIDQDFYFNICNFILDWLGKMQSKADDSKLCAFKEEFILKINSTTFFYELIPLFFKFVLDLLEKIHEEKNQFIEFISKLK
jgi:hypothetical protein